jgi:hypothetical protein
MATPVYALRCPAYEGFPSARRFIRWTMETGIDIVNVYRLFKIISESEQSL